MCSSAQSTGSTLEPQACDIASLLPITYRCPVRDCNQVVLHEIVHITDDLKHDAHLVKKFQTANVQLLQKCGVQICKIIEFTDQALSQYKNRSAFRYLSQETIPTERNFFGVCLCRVSQNSTYKFSKN